MFPEHSARCGLAVGSQPVESCIIGKAFRGEKAGKLGWNVRVCSGMRLVDCLGINVAGNECLPASCLTKVRQRSCLRCVSHVTRA
jgi:hypothetical protein